MVNICFPDGCPGEKGKDRGDIEVGDSLNITFTNHGIFFHDYPDVFTPDLPTGYFAAKSLIVSAPAAGVGQKVTLFFDDLGTQRGRFKYELTVIPAHTRKEAK